MIKRIQKLFGFKKEETEEKLSVVDVINNLFDDLDEDVIALQVGSDLIPFGEYLCKDIIANLRDEIKYECGFILPPIHVTDNTSYQENEFTISVRGTIVETGYVVPNKKGIQDELYSVLKTVIYDNLDKIFTNEIMEKYIDRVEIQNRWLIWNLMSQLSIIDVKTILIDIINSGKSINNITYIFEQIGKNVLVNGEYKDCLKKYNPHHIARNIVKYL